MSVSMSSLKFVVVTLAATSALRISHRSLSSTSFRINCAVSEEERDLPIDLDELARESAAEAATVIPDVRLKERIEELKAPR